MKNVGRWVTIFILCIVMFLIVELPPVQIVASTVFTSSEGTELSLFVEMNTLLPVNKEGMVQKIVEKEQSINGVKENTVYKIHLYRTRMHRKNEWKYDTMLLSEK